MTQKEKQQNTHRRRPIHAQTDTRVRQARWDSHSIRFDTARNGARFECFCAIAVVVVVVVVVAGPRAETVVYNPAIRFGTSFFFLLFSLCSMFVLRYARSMSRKDCVPRTMMMTLVYEITIDLSTRNYIEPLFCAPFRRDFLQFIYMKDINHT